MCMGIDLKRVRELIDEGLTRRQIATALDCHYYSLARACALNGIKLPDGKTGPKPFNAIERKDELMALTLKYGSIINIITQMEILGVDYNYETLRRAYGKLDIKLPKHDNAKVLPNGFWNWNDRVVNVVAEDPYKRKQIHLRRRMP